MGVRDNFDTQTISQEAKVFDGKSLSKDCNKLMDCLSILTYEDQVINIDEEDT